MAVFHDAFRMFCLGTAAVGRIQAFAHYYRLAAADPVDSESKARVISMVLAGCVIATALGPALAAWSKNLFPVLIAGSYLMVSVLGLESALLIGTGYWDVEAPPAQAEPAEPSARILWTIVRQPISVAALANNVGGDMVMMLVMTAAPLAAVGCRHPVDDSANIIQWHLIGMFSLSFFAGRLSHGSECRQSCSRAWA